MNKQINEAVVKFLKVEIKKPELITETNLLRKMYKHFPTLERAVGYNSAEAAGLSRYIAGKVFYEFHPVAAKKH